MGRVSRRAARHQGSEPEWAEEDGHGAEPMGDFSSAGGLEWGVKAQAERGECLHGMAAQCELSEPKESGECAHLAGDSAMAVRV